MIKGHGGARVVQKLNASLSTSHSPPFNLSSIPTCSCPHTTTFLSPPILLNFHISSISDSRYIDFQLTKLKKYAQDGTPVSASGIASLLSKPYITTHQAKELLQLAKRAKCINTQLYNDYLGALSTNGDVKAVIDAIQDMETLGLEPSIRTFNTLLHLVISNASLFPNVLAQIHQKGLEYDVATYNIVMRHYSMVGKPEKCIELESMMEKNGISPNVYTFNQMLHIWAKRGMAKKCDEILERMRAHNIHPTLMSYTILIQMHVNKLKDLDAGLRLFSEMKAQGIVPDSRPYDVLIEALSARGDFQRSVELFNEMQQSGYAGGTMTYSVLIDKFTKEGKFEEGWQIFSQMKEAKQPLRAELWNVFLRYFAQRGDLTQSLAILEDMTSANVQPTTQTYNVLLSTEGMTLDSKLKLWGSMKEHNVERDRFTFNMIIVAYMKEGRYADCEAIFNEMSQLKVQPDPHLYITMRDVYKRAGEMEKAQAMSSAAKKLVRHNLDLRDLVRKKQQKHQLQKRIDFQKDIQEVENLLATKQTTNQVTPATDSTEQTQQISSQPDLQPSNLQPSNLQPSNLQPSNLQPSEQDNFYSPQPTNQYFSQDPNYYSDYKPLYYVPYQTQYVPPSPSTTEQQGLPRRRRVLNQTPSPPSSSPFYSQFDLQGYWGPPWPPSPSSPLPFSMPFPEEQPPNNNFPTSNFSTPNTTPPHNTTTTNGTQNSNVPLERNSEQNFGHQQNPQKK